MINNEEEKNQINISINYDYQIYFNVSLYQLKDSLMEIMGNLQKNLKKKN